jgi:hypothetical protein
MVSSISSSNERRDGANLVVSDEDGLLASENERDHAFCRIERRKRGSA